MAEIATTMSAITKMVRGRMEAVPLNTNMGKSTLNSMRHLVEQLVTFASHSATTKWGGKHRLLLLILSGEKIRLTIGYKNLDYERLNNPKLLDPRIADSFKGRKLLQLQEYQKVE